MTDSPPRRFTLDLLTVTNLRNLQQQSIELHAELNVLAGANGQGKTSVLESIYLLATSRSFRTARLQEAMRYDSPQSNVRGSFTEHWPAAPITREQSVGLASGRRRCRVDGQAPATLAAYATHSPVVVFDAQQLALSTGPASLRRTLLDRVALFTSPASAKHRSRYGRALRERQRLLATAGSIGSLGAQLDAYEQLLAEHGARITEARQRVASVLAVALTDNFARIAAVDLRLAVRYQPGGSAEPRTALRRLHADRSADARRKQATFGPHRDELLIELNDHPMRVVGSQGQHRAVTLAMKIAELQSIARARTLQPILLLDDVSSELDQERTKALFAYLADTRSQLVVTTSRPELITAALPPERPRRDFVVRAGAVIHDDS